MLFHCHHKHDENTCPSGDPERLSATFAAVLPALEANGVKVIGAWIDPPAHEFFFVLETDDYQALTEGLRPILLAGTAKIQPEGDVAARMQATMARLSES